MPPDLQNDFRKGLEALASAAQIKTRFGRLLQKKQSLEFGFRGGRHQTKKCFVYENPSSGHVLYFVFYDNFTPNDLLAKVIHEDDILRPVLGASVQFNADKCFEAGRTLVHHGRVTVEKAIAKAKFISALKTAAPEVANHFQIEPDMKWPLSIGDLSKPNVLLENLFLYAYGVEQVKRHFKSENLMSPLNFPKHNIFDTPENFGGADTKRANLASANGSNDDLQFFEGAQRRVLATILERNSKARNACIAHYGAVCSVCKMSFADRYGKQFEGLIHVHHIKPLGVSSGKRSVDPIKDMRPLCPNCHYCIHSKKQPMTIRYLEKLIRKKD